MYLFKRDYEAARKAYQVLIETDSPRWRTAGREYMTYVPRAQGKVEEATRMLFEGIAADQQETGDYKYRGPLYKLLIVVFPDDVVTWQEGLANTRSGIDLIRRYDPFHAWVAFYQAIELFWELRGGQITAAEADSSFARLRLRLESESPQFLATLVWWGGSIAVEQDRYEDAIELFEEAVSAAKPWIWYYPLPECYVERRCGRIDRAPVGVVRRLQRTVFVQCEDPLLGGQGIPGGRPNGQSDRTTRNFPDDLEGRRPGISRDR
jgi:tetratricopeptide (TPR) repeat protein